MDDNGNVNVREVRQDDLAFRMNASSREVLKEVQFCLLITEPNKMDAPEQRRFQDRVDLRLGAIEAD